MVDVTSQPYAYTGDDPVNATDRSGKDTVGICAGASGQLGPIGVSAGDCLTRTIDASGEDDIGLTGTLGVGAGQGADLSVGVYYQVSTATNLQELSGYFHYATVGGEFGAGASVTVFWNANLSVVGIEVGPSFGAGVDVTYGSSDTWVDQFNGTILANIARGVWNLANPNLNLLELLREALRGVETAIAWHC